MKNVSIDLYFQGLTPDKDIDYTLSKATKGF